MTPAEINRVFGRGRLKMVTGEHVEVFREAVAPGERRRYTKRFLNTPDGDFGQWTEREWRILARLIGHGISCVPDVVQFDRGRLDGAQIVQTYDAGVTVDQWATLLPVTRDGRMYRHVFEDCAHWWALAHHCLAALNAIHPLELVHLDIKGDNVCIPYAPTGFDPYSSGLTLRPVFGELALIDFAFALISRGSLATALPIGWQRDYDYQSPRLLAALEAGRNGDLKPTRELDWRCDLYSLAAMMKRYLPDAGSVLQNSLDGGWTSEQYDAAKALILRIRECHDRDLPAQRPHGELIELTGARLSEPGLASSLERGWSLAREACVSSASASPLTPVTRLAPSIRVTRSGRSTAVTVVAPPVVPATRLRPEGELARPNASPPPVAHAQRRLSALIGLLAVSVAAAALWYGGDRALSAMVAPFRIAADRSADAIPQFTPSDKGTRQTGSAPEKARSPAGEPPSMATPRSVQESAPLPPAQASAPALASAPASLPAETPATTPPPITPDAVANAPVEDDATLPTAPKAQPQSDASGASSAQRRTATGRAPASAASKSPGGIPPKQAGTPSRSANKTTRVPPGVAPGEPRTAQARPTMSTPAPVPAQAPAPAQRVYAPWASLEPPAWARSNYRGKGPGLPPGASTPEAAVKTAPLAEVSSRESAAAAAQPARVAAMTAESLRKEPVVAPLTSPGSTATTPSSIDRGAPDAVSRATSRTHPAAPIEERGEPVRLASSQVAPLVESRRIEQPAPENFVQQGRRMIVSDVPRIAARGEAQVARVLRMAGAAYYHTEERYVAEATRATRVSDDASFFARPTFPGEARRFNDEARAVLGSRRNVAEAFEFQLRAFGANPRDPEVTGNLASLHLRLNPSQPEVARQIALVALVARDPQYHSSRLEDWFTFAVASALAGRESDATNALFVTLALTADVDRRCVAALNALANYGERMRRPVEAMFSRLHAQGRGIDSQACAWPPNWSLVSRSQ